MTDGPTGAGNDNESDTERDNGNVDRWGGGIADTYDRFRPTPPRAVVELLTQLAGGSRPSLVVDLGSGTGLSTRLWAGAADRVIGIEPGDEMRREAVARTSDGTIEYRAGSSTATGLPDACADIVTASQSLHWMDPEPTFAEVARVLRPGGVFAAIDCDWPPTVHWEAERAYAACMKLAFEREATLGLRDRVTQWDKSGHLGRMRASGRFRYVNEVVLHGVEIGNAARFVGLALSQARVHGPLARGATEDEIGLTELRDVARRALGDGPRTWWFSYRVRLGVR
ncbi:MAG: class I SAM-dependent methyltransferase [Planctomycetes bacterium]|nr:class I SAM-dependent methyltransferase [Planctomycetota bacterium]